MVGSVFCKDGKRCVSFGRYSVVEEKKKFYSIYVDETEFIMHRTSWRSAVKIAKLLQSAYSQGYDDRNEVEVFFGNRY